MRRRQDDLVGKGRKKVVKRKKEKGKKLCTYCSKSGHTEDEWWAKNATICSKEKDDSQQMQSSWRWTLGDSMKGHCYISCYIWYLCLIHTWEIQ